MISSTNPSHSEVPSELLELKCSCPFL